MSSLPYVPREAYDRITAVNWSTLKVLGKSPAHYRDALMNKGSDSDARQRGRATHTAVFEFDRYASEYVVWEDRRAGKEWEAFSALNSHREILTAKMNENAVAVSRAVRASGMAAPYVTNGKAEVTLRWEHVSPAVPGFEQYRLDCKARLDFVNALGIADLKTTKDASPTGFARECARYEYHVQAAWYVDGYEAMTGLRVPYVLVAVEPAAPHVVQVYRVPDELLNEGRARYRQLLDTLNVCRRDSAWPGYATTPIDLHLPRWARPLDEGDDENADNLDLVIGTGA